MSGDSKSVVTKDGYEIKPGRTGRPRKTRKARKYLLHGATEDWQFRFEKTSENAGIKELTNCCSVQQFEEEYGIKVPKGFKWPKASKRRIELILMAVAARRSDS